MNSVSVKGVIKKNNSFLLRKNERNEYELLGGKLEKDDINLRDRLKKEFLEESGIKITVKTLVFKYKWRQSFNYSIYLQYRLYSFCLI